MANAYSNGNFCNQSNLFFEGSCLHCCNVASEIILTEKFEDESWFLHPLVL